MTKKKKSSVRKKASKKVQSKKKVAKKSKKKTAAKKVVAKKSATKKKTSPARKSKNKKSLSKKKAVKKTSQKKTVARKKSAASAEKVTRRTVVEEIRPAAEKIKPKYEGSVTFPVSQSGFTPPPVLEKSGTVAAKKAKVESMKFAREAMNATGYLTKNNHFRFGYDGVPFIYRTNKDQKWWVNYGKCTRRPFDWRTECVIAASEIRKNTRRPIWLCFSGGIDSQVVADAFRFAGIPFQIAIMRFNDDINVHDTSWAVIYCENHQIPYKIFDFDILDFMDGGEMLEIARQTQCVSPLLPSSMKLMQMIHREEGGYPILGSAECYLSIHKKRWVMYEREKIASVYRYLLMNKIPGQAGFFQWNPEIMVSFLKDKLVKELVRNKLPNYYSTYYLKHQIYAQYFDLVPRTKYTGYEKVDYLDDKYRPQLEAEFGDCDQTVYIPYSELLKAIDYRPRQPRQQGKKA